MPLAYPKPVKAEKVRKGLRRSGPPARKSRPPVMQRGALATLERQADALFRRLVAGRAERCRNCGVHRSVVPLETAHHITRGAKAVRWDLDNASPLCAECHRYFTRRPKLWAMTWRRWIGDERADRVTELARVGCRLSVPYMEAVVAGLKSCF